ncbi:hypothetical protein M6K083_2583 [Staphylococcus aureus]|uniref:hypothetical protein n=1 Tax=Staphylococcus aureus TaxID=1280 RepID=UPI000E3C4AAA|nr:hypothetical protein [Staphylococcus aureus]GBY79188.1 hypothetical protein M6K083_2583 [Staphylococcus aureus]
MSSNLDKYSAKKRETNEIKETPFDKNIKKKEDFKLVKIDPKIHLDLKFAALKEDTTMKAVVDKAIKEYLEKYH